MKVLIIGGNRFVGLRVSHALSRLPGCDLHIVNRTGQVPQCPDAVIYKCDRRNLSHSHLDRDWDVIVDFACYNDEEARESTEYFGKVGRYIFVSTKSVYDPKGDLTESDFNPEKLDLSQAPLKNYQDGKRRAEAVFSGHSFPVLSVRFPVILGSDDYTRRLEFYVQRIEKGQPIFIAAPKAKISMIHAADAAEFLLWSMNQTATGPLNVAAPEPLGLDTLIAQIESSTGKKAILFSKATDENSSPYGPPADFFMNLDRLHGLGFKAKSINT